MEAWSGGAVVMEPHEAGCPHARRPLPALIASLPQSTARSVIEIDYCLKVTHTHTHTHTHALTYTRIHTHTHTHTHTQTPLLTGSHRHRRTQTGTQTHTHLKYNTTNYQQYHVSFAIVVYISKQADEQTNTLNPQVVDWKCTRR